MHSEKQLAQQIVVEILCQAGDGLTASALHKAFWLAHLYFTKKAPGYLSGWPIIHTPQGPGIGEVSDLLRELELAGHIEVGHEPNGPFSQTTYRFKQSFAEGLADPAVWAIQQAIADVRKFTTAYALSSWSQETSRSWREADDGEELNIYLDLIPEEEYEEQLRALKGMQVAFEECINEPAH